MDSWKPETQSPDVEFEASPAESFLSMPGEIYPPLFGAAGAPATMNPLEIMTPHSFSDEKPPAALTDLATDLPDPAQASTPAPEKEKKPAKKRKSWGQVLPEPKTNLPPRKRAKTEDEKEQRRVERVLRNRRAAQSSRERKRLEVEALEQRNKELEGQLLNAHKANMMLCEELGKLRAASGVVARNAVTFSQELFSSHDGHAGLAEPGKSPIEQLMIATQAQSTINPVSLSPALSPVPDASAAETDGEPAEKADDKPVVAADAAAKTSPDMTQHPAEVLCPDLQCQSAEVSRSWTVSQRRLPPALALYCQLTLLLASTSTLLSVCSRPLTQIAMSLRAGFSLPPTPALLNTILWLVTTPSPSRATRTSTSTTSSSTTRRPASATLPPTASRRPTRFPTTLRLKLLRKILTCSPMLARPLTDATMAALRSVRSEETLDVARVGREAGSSAGRPWAAEGSLPPGGASLPSREVLLTLLWALKVEERKIDRKGREGNTASSPPGRPSSATTSNNTLAPTSSYTKLNKIVLHVTAKRRARGDGEKCDGKRRRVG